MFPHYVKAHKATEEGTPGVCWGGDQADSGAERGRDFRSSDGLSVTLYSSYPSSTQINSDSTCVNTRAHTHAHMHVAKTSCHHILKPSKCACQKGSRLTAVLSPPGGSRGQACLSQEIKRGTTKRIKIRQSDRRTLTQWRYIVKGTRGPGSFSLARVSGQKQREQVSCLQEKT